MQSKKLIFERIVIKYLILLNSFQTFSTIVRSTREIKTASKILNTFSALETRSGRRLPNLQQTTFKIPSKPIHITASKQAKQKMPFDATSWRLPEADGLYDPANERDACGVGFIVNIDGIPSHNIMKDATTLTNRMKHRGAESADNDTGDGAGVMVAMPHTFYEKELR